MLLISLDSGVSIKMSEFGKGLVICLVKFSEHFERNNPLMSPLALRHGIWSDRDKEMCKDVFDNDKEKYLSHVIGLWANGASDHLYEIEVPEGQEWNEIRNKVKELQDKGLEIGHGFTGKTWTIIDFNNLISLTREIALMIDKKIGLIPDGGEN